MDGSSVRQCSRFSYMVVVSKSPFSELRSCRIEDAVSQTHMRRMGSRLGRMGRQRNAGLFEDCEERGFYASKARAHVDRRGGRGCLCRAAQFVNGSISNYCFYLGGEAIS